MLFAWYGQEQEGKRYGMPTLFIRGGHEDKLKEALEVCKAQNLPVDQIYFGAGSCTPDFEKIKVIQADENLLLKVITIEVTAEVARHMPAMGGAHIMICVEVDALPVDITLKARTKVAQQVSIKTRYNRFPDESGPYTDDKEIL